MGNYDGFGTYKFGGSGGGGAGAKSTATVSTPKMPYIWRVFGALEN